jgi:hypothetical protein
LISVSLLDKAARDCPADPLVLEFGFERLKQDP